MIAVYWLIRASHMYADGSVSYNYLPQVIHGAIDMYESKCMKDI